jgi:hypothetical protein
LHRPFLYHYLWREEVNWQKKRRVQDERLMERSGCQGLISAIHFDSFKREGE